MKLISTIFELYSQVFVSLFLDKFHWNEYKYAVGISVMIFILC